MGPWAQPKATRREGGRRAERPAGSSATPRVSAASRGLRTAAKPLRRAEACYPLKAREQAQRAPRARGQPRRGCHRTKPMAHSDVGRLWSRRAAGFLLHTFLSPSKEKCERPMGQQVPIRAVVGASGSPGGHFLRQSCRSTTQQGAFLGANNRSGPHCRVRRADCSSAMSLLHRHALRQISRLIYITAPLNGHAVRK